VVVALVVAILVARAMIVPEDFGAHEMGYMYGWHRQANEEEWKNFKIKYQGKEYCRDCHYENYELNSNSPHAIIQCENCHGPAIAHPAEPEKLEINRSRQQCLRCHARLPYEQSGRAWIRGINNDEHNPGTECVMCHNPHKPGFD
jgi:hypothetical protein